MAGQNLSIQQFSRNGKTWWSAVDQNGNPQAGPWYDRGSANSWLQDYQGNNNQNVTTSGLKAEARGQDVYSSDVDSKYADQISGFAGQYTPPTQPVQGMAQSRSSARVTTPQQTQVDGFAFGVQPSQISNTQAPANSYATTLAPSNQTPQPTSAAPTLPAYDDPIVTAYRDILGRNPGQEGYDFWNGALGSGMSINEIRSQMAASDEAMGTVSAPTTGLLNIVNPNAQPAPAPAPQQPSVDMAPVTDGFATTNQNLGVVNDNIGAVNDNLTTGFDGMAQGMTDGFAGVNQNVVDTGQTILDNQADIGNNLAQNQAQNTETILGGQSALNDALSQASSDLMTSQQGITQQLTQAGNNMAQYYADLMQGQQTIGGGIDGFAADFGDFRNQYDTDVVAATNMRTDTQEMVQGGFEAVRDDMSTQASAQQQGQEALMQRVGTAQMGIADGGGFAGMPQNPAAPQAPADPAQGSIAQGVNLIRENLQNLLPRVSPDVQRGFIGVANSFDDQGRLVQNGQDSEGNTMIRSMDRSGILTLRGMDPNGNMIGQTQISVPQVFNIASQVMRGTGGGFAG
jgi:hypothetical protein